MNERTEILMFAIANYSHVLERDSKCTLKSWADKIELIYNLENEKNKAVYLELKKPSKGVVKKDRYGHTQIYF